MEFHATRGPYVIAPVLNILFTLSSIDTALWLKILDPVFCTRFYSLAVACPADSVREHAWNCLRGFFAKCCQGAYSNTNGTEENGSDVEHRMDIDQKPSEVREIIAYLWQVVINCLVMAKNDIPHAAKAFDTAADLLRYVLVSLTDPRVYYKSLSPAAAENGVALLLRTSKLACIELFDHTVQESILTHDVDYFTLGLTRILHAALDLMPSEQTDELLPRYVHNYCSNDSSFTSDVTKTFLFPDLRSEDVYGGELMKPYCIHSETRSALFDILFKLANTQSKRNLIAAYVSDLLERGISLCTTADTCRQCYISR